MKNESQIKAIIATFVQHETDQITEHTVIDRTAMQSSIHVHRMYAAIADAGVHIENPARIRTFGDLLRATGMAGDTTPCPSTVLTVRNSQSGGLAVGIDIEEIASFAVVPDYRENAFYRQNFSAAEIAWCILQPSPVASFGGKFAAKEAIVKAANEYRTVPFNRIEILNMPDGRPQFNGFEISISHSPTTAIAVAVSLHRELPLAPTPGIPSPARDRLLWVVAVAALVLSLVDFLRH